MARKPDQPHVIVLAGPNGAGKSTVAPALLAGALGITEFVNADVIARGLSGFDPENSAMDAGRIMLLRLKELAANRRSFAFETTLASRSFAPWIARLRRKGYAFHPHFLRLSSADLAVARVQERVATGGHDVPEKTIRRRYQRGSANFFRLYRPLTSTWHFYDNYSRTGYRLIAAGRGDTVITIVNKAIWQAIIER
jgi:predicted ABC-type ATPase